MLVILPRVLILDQPHTIFLVVCLPLTLLVLSHSESLLIHNHMIPISIFYHLQTILIEVLWTAMLIIDNLVVLCVIFLDVITLSEHQKPFIIVESNVVLLIFDDFEPSEIVLLSILKNPPLLINFQVLPGFIIDSDFVSFLVVFSMCAFFVNFDDIAIIIIANDFIILVIFDPISVMIEGFWHPSKDAIFNDCFVSCLL